MTPTEREDLIWMEAQRDEATEAQRTAERTLISIDRVLVKRVMGEVSTGEAMQQIEALVGAWTDPKGDA